MLKRTLAVLIALLMIAAVFAGCNKAGKTETTDPPSVDENVGTEDTGKDTQPAAEKESIVFGGVRSQSGVFATFDETAFGPCYRMWADKVNAEGGIYVEEYGKKLPVELIIYDDKSDMATMTRLYEKLILEDKVDFLLPPVSTAFLYATAPIADKHGYLLIGAEGGSTTLLDSIAQYPGFFSVLNFSVTQVPALVDILVENEIESAYIVYIEDLHGTEYSGASKPALEEVGIEVHGMKAIPPDIQDMTSIINDAIDSGADAFLLFAYPDQNFLAMNQAMAMGYNPDVFLVGPGGNFEFIKGVFGGAEAVEGLMSWGGWNEKSSEKAAQFAKEFLEYNKDDPKVSIDWWGHLPYYTGLEMLQQAIEKAGTLDNARVIEVLKSEKFDTVMGEVWFENQLLASECYLGNVGQWQNGIFEVIDVGENRTADPIVPKPAWPAE
ncbi:MAG: ABC transporter substrate-binding protein [Clostridiales bacterium]|jgi:branched-chain amino acid transport system substrate-binding protein|nr:ABC transporter substrate-binding protein [Clostridiales bacterium]